jgi:hypothetical protein
MLRNAHHHCLGITVLFSATVTAFAATWFNSRPRARRNGLPIVSHRVSVAGMIDRRSQPGFETARHTNVL